jgi:IclR family transcriptional regulator, acetate operon repressor
VRLALSVSGPAARMSDELVQQAVPLLQRAAASLAEDLA